MHRKHACSNKYGRNHCNERNIDVDSKPFPKNHIHRKHVHLKPFLWSKCEYGATFGNYLKQHSRYSHDGMLELNVQVEDVFVDSSSDHNQLISFLFFTKTYVTFCTDNRALHVMIPSVLETAYFFFLWDPGGASLLLNIPVPERRPFSPLLPGCPH